MKINIKPLSVNNAWQGRRFSTPEKKRFEQIVMMKLRGSYLDIPPPYHVKYTFYIPKLQDIDNCIKTFQDCLTKFYGFNDRDIYRITAEKIAVPKGEERIEFDIVEYK